MTSEHTVTSIATSAKAVERPLKVRRALSAMGWWKSLQPQELSDGRGTTAGDRATLARLRRASSVFEVACEPSVSALHTMLKFDAPSRDRDIIASAVLAGVLAHIREQAKMRLAAAMGAPIGDRQTVSALRMRRFMMARDADDVMQQFRRVIAMLGHQANVFDVALLVLHWLDPTEAGDRARTRFAFAYHGHANAAPDDESGEQASGEEPPTPDAAN
jgi:CRISPR system Cascade subunit CasB